MLNLGNDVYYIIMCFELNNCVSLSLYEAYGFLPFAAMLLDMEYVIQYYYNINLGFHCISS